MRGAIDEAVGQIDRKIRKNKTRLAKNLRAEAVLPELPEEFEAHEEGTFDIVRTKRFTVKPMSVEEAILQMNLLGHSFFVFRNTDFGDAICVVYRRNNGGYGIIETEEPPELLSHIATDLIIHELYVWCSQNGNFCLRERARQYAEVAYHVKPQYRMSPEQRAAL